MEQFWGKAKTNNLQVSQSYLQDKTKVNVKIMTQTVCFKHSPQFTDQLSGLTSRVSPQKLVSGGGKCCLITANEVQLVNMTFLSHMSAPNCD